MNVISWRVYDNRASAWVHAGGIKIPPLCLYQAKKGHIYADLSGKVAVLRSSVKRERPSCSCTDSYTSHMDVVRLPLPVSLHENKTHVHRDHKRHIWLPKPERHNTLLPSIASTGCKQTELGMFVFVIKVIAQVPALSRCNHRTSIR